MNSTMTLGRRTSAAIIELAQQLQAERTVTVIMVTHDSGIASRAERVVHLQDGPVANGGAH